MKFKETKGIARNGKEITVRTAIPTDAAGLLKLKLGYIEGTTTIPLYPDEYTNSKEDEAALTERYLKQPNSVFLVAEHNSELIGNIDITGNQRRKLYHTGVVGMGISYEWQNNGIGSLLLYNALEWAKHNSPLTIVWLEVYSNNKIGLQLYANMGFKICGEIKDFFTGADKITMVKYL